MGHPGSMTPDRRGRPGGQEIEARVQEAVRGRLSSDGTLQSIVRDLSEGEARDQLPPSGAGVGTAGGWSRPARYQQAMASKTPGYRSTA